MAKLVYRFLESAYKQYIENWCASRGYKVEDWNSLMDLMESHLYLLLNFAIMNLKKKK